MFYLYVSSDDSLSSITCIRYVLILIIGFYHNETYLSLGEPSIVHICIFITFSLLYSVHQQTLGEIET